MLQQFQEIIIFVSRKKINVTIIFIYAMKAKTRQSIAYVKYKHLASKINKQKYPLM